MIFAGVVLAGLSLVDLLILIVVIAACIAIVFIALRVFGITIPPWAIQMFWVVVVAVCAILAIKIVASLL